MGTELSRIVRVKADSFKTMRLAVFFSLATVFWVSGFAAEGGRFFRISGPATTRIISMSQEGTVAWTNGQPGAVYLLQTAANPLGGTNWVDYLSVTGASGINSTRVVDFHPPENMAFIPAGSFTQGDSLDGDGTALPLHTVQISAFYMDQYDVAKGLWDKVYAWALAHGYRFDQAGLADGLDHPVSNVNWYDCVKWCNARSELAGRKPAYYTDAALRTPYRSGQLVPHVDWSSGFRLPTEAEWEKAARGGPSGRRYPWGDTINQQRAHYDDPSETTTRVDMYPPNGYSLYDMSGNVWQWCWDWYGGYGDAWQADPHGPATGTRHVTRGGGMVSPEYQLRTAARTSDVPTFSDNYVGFRSVCPAGQ